ncbi:MAG: zinc ribbon domain-containing protein, partial [Oscillospiraceae bacterium]|nr:zinc ribbon domain-containing protein [Oscillospiraceae bacterium]
MYCPKCQARLPQPRPDFCPNCGQDLHSYPAEREAPANTGGDRARIILLSVFAVILSGCLILAGILIFRNRGGEEKTEKTELSSGERLPEEEPSSDTIPASAVPVDPSEESSIPSQELPTDPDDPEPEIPTGYNVMDIDFADLIDSTSSDTIKNIHSYVNSQIPS